jgi:predicted dehydrogenase
MTTQRPRLGFLGVGWIGRHRLEAIARSGMAEVAAIADPAPELVRQAAELAPDAILASSLEDLLEIDLDGLVIATPSALHAAQSVAAFERGLAVFCQKPLGRDAAEAQAVVRAASAADRLLGVDLSYRHISGMEQLRGLIQGGELGHVYAVNAVFHNAYGPDKAWFYDPALSGGGCVIDLGIHLVDLAMWMLNFPAVESISSQLFAQGEPLDGRPDRVEDYAAAVIGLAGGTALQLACSWKLPAGCDCVIEAAFYGTRGGAALRNAGGSFYDFTVERFHGTRRETLAGPPDEWGGRAAVDWAARLARGERFDPASERLVAVARTLDGIYGRRSQ